MKSKYVAGLIFAVSILIIANFIFFAPASEILATPPSPNIEILPAYSNTLIDQNISVNVSSGNAILNISIPENISGTQYVSVEEISGLSYTINNEYNRTWWSWDLNRSADVQIIYNATLYTHRTYINPAESGTVSQIPQYLKNEYDHPEYLFNNLEVIDPAYFANNTVIKNITKGENTVYGLLMTIYNYIVTNFKYDIIYNFPNFPITAVQTWEQKEGDCAELSFLYVSIVRSLGIPAWLEFGLGYSGSNWGGHAWIGTDIPLKNGTLVSGIIDLTVEVGTGHDYSAGFFISSPYRITEWVDDGNSTHLSQFYTLMLSSGLSTINDTFNTVFYRASGTYIIDFSNYALPYWIVYAIIIAADAIVLAFIIKK
jgi:hypothetical protein